MEARQKDGIKVRQPIASLKIKNQKSKIKDNKEILNLIKDEVNVKEIIFDDKINPPGGGEIELDTIITPELKNEGIARELIRNIQDLRKKEGLMPQQKIGLIIDVGDDGKKLIKQFEAEIKRGTNAATLEFNQNDGEEIKIDELKFKIKIQK